METVQSRLVPNNDNNKTIKIGNVFLTICNYKVNSVWQISSECNSKEQNPRGSEQR